MTLPALRRACVAEWTRTWTVLTSWWFAGATAVFMVGMAALMALDARQGEIPDATAWGAGEMVASIGQFGLLALVVLAVTADYGTRGIVTSMQWTPRRGVLFAARTGTAIATATLLGVVATALSAIVARLILPAVGLPAGEGAETLGWVALVLACGTAVAAGLGFLLRSTAGALVGMSLLMLVLPLILPVFPFDWAEDLASLLPGTGAFTLLLGEFEVTTERAVTVLLAWAAAASVAGGWRFLRTDADS